MLPADDDDEAEEEEEEEEEDMVVEDEDDDDDDDDEEDDVDRGAFRLDDADTDRADASGFDGKLKRRGWVDQGNEMKWPSVSKFSRGTLPGRRVTWEGTVMALRLTALQDEMLSMCSERLFSSKADRPELVSWTQPLKLRRFRLGSVASFCTDSSDTASPQKDCA